MRTERHIQISIPRVLAASVLIVGLTAGAGPGFARGGGGGIGGGSHGSSAQSGGMRSGGIVMPGAGMARGYMPGSHMTTIAPTALTNTTSAMPSFRHEEHGHHPQPSPPPGGNTTSPNLNTTVVVPDTTPQNTLPNVAPAESAAAVPATPTTTSVNPPSVGLTQDATVATSGGTLAPVTAGGGGDTLASCMTLWDAGTHMSRPEWRDTCVRTLNGMDIGGGVTVAGGTAPAATQTTAIQRRATAKVVRQRSAPRSSAE